MKTYIGKTDVIPVAEANTIDLENYDDVLGYSIDVPINSTSDAFVSINGGPQIRLVAGGPSRPFGGFLGSCPVFYKDQIDVKFEDPAGAANMLLCILTHVNCKEE